MSELNQWNAQLYDKSFSYIQNMAFELIDRLAPEAGERIIDLGCGTVGLEVTRNSAIKHVKPGGTIVHIGLSQPSGVFDFRKTTLQEVTFVGTYCYTNKDFENTLDLLSKNQIGDLNWIEFKNLSSGAEAFKEIHDGTCSAPKIILIP